jgi:hypothetical protein
MPSNRRRSPGVPAGQARRKHFQTAERNKSREMTVNSRPLLQCGRSFAPAVRYQPRRKKRRESLILVRGQGKRGLLLFAARALSAVSVATRWLARGGRGPRTIDELLQDAAENGTHSILDIDHTADIPAFGCATPLSKQRLLSASARRLRPPSRSRRRDRFWTRSQATYAGGRLYT